MFAELLAKLNALYAKSGRGVNYPTQHCTERDLRVLINVEEQRQRSGHSTGRSYMSGGDASQAGGTKEPDLSSKPSNPPLDVKGEFDFDLPE